VSQAQIDACASRIRDQAARDRFVRMMARADELIAQAVELRKLAWSDYRRLAGEVMKAKP
jgi:hypothetical protein